MCSNDVCSEDSCWICLAGAESGPLERPCRCPRSVHLSCLGRWQLQQVGVISVAPAPFSRDMDRWHRCLQGWARLRIAKWMYAESPTSAHVLFPRPPSVSLPSGWSLGGAALPLLHLCASAARGQPAAAAPGARGRSRHTLHGSRVPGGGETGGGGRGEEGRGARDRGAWIIANGGA